ncbi:hypothetical protein PBY51_014734 [Eleginops maclovinus]|uniref:Uncharacterized protein n=1 Tax=Eleginops maclovinus TaxID=56733 RepID=A0AAN7X1R6_ELEMC|nr:hypothetical protein PBY51_014734 [Eleginops maclovinus]
MNSSKYGSSLCSCGSDRLRVRADLRDSEPLSAVLNLDPRITSRPEGGQIRGSAREQGGNLRQTEESKEA